MKIRELHRRALEASRKYFQAEAELLELLQEIDACKGFRDLGHASLFSYAVDGLKLSESTALNLINVARKSLQIPALKTEIQAGNLSVSKARKIVPVLSVLNQAEWIEKAKTLPTRKLEGEIARVAPGEAFPERVRYATETRVNLSLSLDGKILEKIRRVQDIESQKKNRAVTLEETLAAMSAFYVERNDPVEKAKRAAAKTKSEVAKAGQKCSDVTRHIYTRRRRENVHHENVSDIADSPKRNRQPIPAAVGHEVALRDAAQCTAIALDGNRCERRRWLHVHHIKPVSEGGQDTVENLITLCSSHHQMRHDQRGSPSQYRQFARP